MIAITICNKDNCSKQQGTISGCDELKIQIDMFQVYLVCKNKHIKTGVCMIGYR